MEILYLIRIFAILRFVFFLILSVLGGAIFSSVRVIKKGKTGKAIMWVICEIGIIFLLGWRLAPAEWILFIVFILWGLIYPVIYCFIKKKIKRMIFWIIGWLVGIILLNKIFCPTYWRYPDILIRWTGERGGSYLLTQWWGEYDFVGYKRMGKGTDEYYMVNGYYLYTDKQGEKQYYFIYQHTEGLTNEIRISKGSKYQDNDESQTNKIRNINRSYVVSQRRFFGDK